MTTKERCVLLLLVFCIKTRQSFQLFNSVIPDCKLALSNEWWLKQYFTILEQSYQLLVLSETTERNDPLSEYSTVLFEQIHKNELIPVTGLVIMTNTCSQSLPIPDSKLFLLLSMHEKAVYRVFQNVQMCIPQWDTSAHFMIIILRNFWHDNENKEKALAMSIFEHLWVKERILNVFIVTRHSHFSCEINETKNSIKVWGYNPFEINTHNSRGNIYNFEYGRALFNEHTDNRLRNVHGYPLHVSMFTQYPTAIPVTSVTNNSTRYEGMDGHMLYTTANYFNFSLRLYTSYGNSTYGSVLQNGSMIGSLADIVYGRTEISFNSRFITWYGTDDIDFSIPVASDKLCIVTPKAKQIPKWKNMLVCYKTEVWLSLFMVYVVCAVCFHFLHKYHLQNQSAGCLPALDMFQVFILSPVYHSPGILMQRLLFVSCLLFSLVLMSTFQGLMVTNITSPNYATDIHTLDELYDSNLQILTESISTKKLLTDAERAISEKIQVYDGPREEIIQKVLMSKAAITERESSIKFLAVKYASPKGAVRIHMVEECPSYYYLAYVVPKHSPYLREFNSFFRKVLEPGLTQKWYWDSIDIKTRLSYGNSHLQPKTLKLFSLSDLQLAFYILATGLLLSSLTFVAELLWAQSTCSHYKF
jgi:hypothetical protein